MKSLVADVAASPSSRRTSQFFFKNARTARQSCPLGSTALRINWSSNLLYLRCAALGFVCKGFSLLLRVELSTTDMELVKVLEVVGIAILPTNAASGKRCPLSRPSLKVRNLKVVVLYNLRQKAVLVVRCTCVAILTACYHERGKSICIIIKLRRLHCS